MIYCFCVMLFTILIICGIILYGIHIEKKDFNSGICPKCGKKLKWFDTDSQGGRGYCCHDCRYFIWVSYNCVDKDYECMEKF